MGEIVPVLLGAHGSPQRSLHYIEDARSLFEPHLPCDEAQLRKVYLRLALMYHPDKHSGSDRELATALFQAIGAAYEELLRPFGGKAVKRVKSAVAAAAELGDVKELERLLRELPSRAQEPDDVGVFPLMFAAKGRRGSARQLPSGCERRNAFWVVRVAVCWAWKSWADGTLACILWRSGDIA